MNESDQSLLKEGIGTSNDHTGHQGTSVTQEQIGDKSEIESDKSDCSHQVDSKEK